MPGGRLSTQQHLGAARMPHPSADPSASFKRPKLVGDGYEASYLVPGPSNRILLSLKSGLPVQIDWALSRLVHITANNRDPAAREFTLDSVPGLADALISYVRRIHAALTGQPASRWAASYFEQPADTIDVGVGAPGDTGHSGTTSSSLSLTLTRNASSSHTQTGSFNPAIHADHAILMRRTLEAALALRNFATHSANVRSLAAVKGIFALIRDILSLPITAVHNGVSCTSSHDTESSHEDGWLEMDGIAELRLYFFDILESLASRVVLTRRAPNASSNPPSANGSLSHSAEARPPTSANSPGDDILALLLSCALHSKDRAFLLGSLRCLGTMAANERNEAAFVESTQPDGQQSPGLLQRCVELLPVTQDVELLEPLLDLLYQLVCIGNNAIKIASALSLDSRRPLSPSSGQLSASNGRSGASRSDPRLVTRATARTAALVRFLSRNLQLGRTMWERVMPLRVPQDWIVSIPNRQLEAMRRSREVQMRLARETPEERAQRKKLTRRERREIAGLKEPERGIAWMQMVFQRNPEREVTQMEFWTAYKEEFQVNNDGVPLQAAAELIRAVSTVFPQAAAMVIPAQENQPQRFVIRGIDVKERQRDQLEPCRCCWSTCPAPETNTLEAQKRHAKLHVEHAVDGRCRWKNCSFDFKNSPGAGAVAEVQQVLMAHVLTHLKTDGSAAAKKARKLGIVVDDDLNVVSGATHTGEAAPIVTGKGVNGARALRARRKSDGGEVSFTLDKADSAQAGGNVREAKISHSAARSDGTVDNPGMYVFDVTRTPTTGNDDALSPMGPAFTSVLVLRMLTRRAASLLQKAGTKEDGEGEEQADAAAMRGFGDEKFGLPLPANFGASERGKRSEAGESGDAADEGANGSALGGDEEDYETTASWAVESANRVLDAVESVEEELMHHASENDILSSYINETLMELRRRPANSVASSKASTSASLVGRVDPSLSL